MEATIVKSDKSADISGLISYYVNQLEKKEFESGNSKDKSEG